MNGVGEHVRLSGVNMVKWYCYCDGRVLRAKCIVLLVPAAGVCDVSFQFQGLLPSLRWVVDTMVFDAMDTPCFRGLVEVSGTSGACCTVGAKGAADNATVAAVDTEQVVCEWCVEAGSCFQLPFSGWKLRTLPGMEILRLGRTLPLAIVRPSWGGGLGRWRLVVAEGRGGTELGQCKRGLWESLERRRKF